jgi:hypothetical protein
MCRDRIEIEYVVVVIIIIVSNLVFDKNTGRERLQHISKKTKGNVQLLRMNKNTKNNKEIW